MTDPDVIARKLAIIETCVADLRRLARLDALETDVREQRFVEHTLQLAIQAAIDVASRIVSDERAGEPRTSREVFRMLAQRQMIESDLAAHLEEMAGFRNVLVHMYEQVDLSRVRTIVTTHLDDLLLFAAQVRRMMDAR